jgi:DeoR/GlpR family transcriptional regulator of sugar metabolism
LALPARHQEILKILANRGKLGVRELTSRLNVSEVTIRKDLSLLEEMGFLVRTRGGAGPAADKELLRPITVRRKEHLDRKTAIAERAREFIREGDTIYLDSGSTATALASLCTDMSLRVVTNSVDIVLALSEAEGVAVYCIGGSYRKDAGSFIGPMALEALKNFHVETCFIGATGFSSEGLFSSQNILESEVKRQAMRVSKRRVLMVDSSKYGSSAFSVFARPEDVTILITDSDFPEADRIRGLGIDVLLAESGAVK